MRKLTIISVVLVVSAILILPLFPVVADEGVPWFGLIPYLLTGGPPSGEPKAIFSADPTSGQVSLIVDFVASSSTDPDGSIESYEWDFDDGNSDTGEQVSYTYMTAGDYTPELTVTDDDGKTDSYSDLTISVSSSQSLTASFTAAPTGGTAPLEVSFDASGSSDPDSSIDSYNWDFGDGSTDSGETVTHTYTSSGNYTAQLTVEDDDGATDSTTVNISVSSTTNASPNASFTADPTSGIASLEVSFDASDSNDPDGSVESYSWGFGDGSTGSGETTNHTFDSSGDYTVELTVTDNDDVSDSITGTISVTSSNEPPTIFNYYVNPNIQEVNSVSYFALSGGDNDGTLEKWIIKLGNQEQIKGNVDSSTVDKETTYSYSQQGRKDTTLKLYDDDNASTTSSTKTTYIVSEIVDAYSLPSDVKKGDGFAMASNSFWRSSGGRLFKISFPSMETEKTVNTSQPLGPLSLGNSQIWAADHYDPMIFLVDPNTGDFIKTFELPSQTNIEGIAFSGDYVWVATSASNQPSLLYKVDPQTGDTVNFYELPTRPYPDALTWMNGWLWLQAEEVVRKINPQDGEVVEEFELPMEIGSRGILASMSHRSSFLWYFRKTLDPNIYKVNPQYWLGN